LTRCASAPRCPLPDLPRPSIHQMDNVAPMSAGDRLFEEFSVVGHQGCAGHDRAGEIDAVRKWMAEGERDVERGTRGLGGGNNLRKAAREVVQRVERLLSPSASNSSLVGSGGDSRIIRSLNRQILKTSTTIGQSDNAPQRSTWAVTKNLYPSWRNTTGMGLLPLPSELLSRPAHPSSSLLAITCA